MIGRTLGHYRIREEIGAGGMGVVYRAWDEHLGRDVAIKVLPPGTLSDEVARRRFRGEAEALAKLNHPNIETVHDFDTQDGIDFLVTEYIPGATLDEKQAGRPLSEKETLGLGRQLADGLAAAHEHGVIHRDLKPANLRITPDGRLKILDFGLAKLLRPKVPEATASLTETRGVTGTVPYMSPEQLRGEAVDGRTDIWGAGVVFYEMATGRRPFRAELGTRLADDILHQAPPPPSTVNHHVSSGLEDIILKALEKEPERRYQSARELAVDFLRLSTVSGAVLPGRPRRRYGAWVLAAGVLLVAVLAILWGLNPGGMRQRILGHGGPPQIRSLAVLPLDNLSGDPEQEYFSDGMTEALIAELSKIKALKVISRTSAMQYKGVRKPLPKIARELDVDGIVEGSVLREGDQVRVTVQLIHGTTDQHLWADSFQRELRGILALQSEIAVAIAREIRIAVTPDEESYLARTSQVDPRAHELVLKAKFLLQQEGTNRESLDKSVQLFRQAIQLDPGFAEAWSGLSVAYNMVAGVGYMPMRVACTQYQSAADRAIELDPTLGEAYTGRAAAKFYCDWDWAGAEADSLRALQLSPGSAQVHDTYAWQLSSWGRHEEALEHSRIARQLDPLSITVAVHRAMYFYRARRYDKAVGEDQQVLAFSPENIFAKWQLGTTLTAQGKYDQAIPMFLGREVASPDTQWMLGYAYGLSGNRREARRVLAFLLDKQKKQFIWPTIIAVVYIGLDDMDHAFAWLEKSYAEREYWLPMLKVDPMYDPVRSDPRFQDLLRRMNFPE